MEAADLKQGDSLRIRFHLPGSSALIDAFGSVAWVREGRQGIQFTKMSSQNGQDIRNFIAAADKYDEPAK